MKNVVWINGMPRSGTSWLSQIFDSHINVSFKLSPLFSYAYKDYIDEYSPKSKWEDLFEKVFFSKDEFINQTYRRASGEYPIFEKQELTHLVIKDTRYHNLTHRLLELFNDIKLIHIVRHPAGAINSWLRAPKEFPQELNPLDEWRTGNCRKKSKEEFWGFNDWLSLTKMYLELERKYPKNVKVVFYENILNNSKIQVADMFAFCNLKMLPQTVDFLFRSNSVHSNSEYAVFKSKSVATKWRTQLDPKIKEEIKKELIINELDYLFNE